MPRFVILTHDYPHLHWDLMLEEEGSLLTWRLEVQLAENEPVAATPLPNHRLHYLDYEGPVSRNRGHVKRWDSGSFEWLNRGAEQIRIRIQGERLSGILYVKKSGSGESWVASYSSEGGC